MIALRTVLPGRVELIPWTDKKNRFHPLRATVLALLFAPVAWLAIRWAAGMLGPEPVNAAIHSTGYWTIWLLLAALVVRPAKALAWSPNLIVVRRMLGNAALAYALLHLTLYATDQKWRLLTIVAEIVKRFYLTIGFAALLGLLVLGLTSTDGWARALGPRWKTLHRTAYVLTVLGLVHYLLQSKLDVSQALLAGGVFSWLMLWRALPSGRDREWAPLLAISFAATALTLAYEYGWYRFGTRADPLRILRGELDVSFGLSPAGQVLALGLLATAAAELRRWSQLRPDTRALTMLVFALSGLLDRVVALFAGWSLDDLVPASALASAGLLAIVGLVRWSLRATPQRRLVDAMALACLVDMLWADYAGTPDHHVAGTLAALAGSLALLLGRRLWPLLSRGTAL